MNVFTEVTPEFSQKVIYKEFNRNELVQEISHLQNIEGSRFGIPKRKPRSEAENANLEILVDVLKNWEEQCPNRKSMVVMLFKTRKRNKIRRIKPTY